MPSLFCCSVRLPTRFPCLLQEHYHTLSTPQPTAPSKTLLTHVHRRRHVRSPPPVPDDHHVRVLAPVLCRLRQQRQRQLPLAHPPSLSTRVSAIMRTGAVGSHSLTLSEPHHPATVVPQPLSSLSVDTDWRNTVWTPRACWEKSCPSVASGPPPSTLHTCVAAPGQHDHPDAFQAAVDATVALSPPHLQPSHATTRQAPTSLLTEAFWAATGGDPRAPDKQKGYVTSQDRNMRAQKAVFVFGRDELGCLWPTIQKPARTYHTNGSLHPQRDVSASVFNPGPKIGFSRGYDRRENVPRTESVLGELASSIAGSSETIPNGPPVRYLPRFVAYWTPLLHSVLPNG